MQDIVKSHDNGFVAEVVWDGRVIKSKVSCKYVLDPRNNKYLGIKYLPRLMDNGMYEAEGSIRVSTQEGYDDIIAMMNTMLREYEMIRNIVEE